MKKFIVSRFSDLSKRKSAGFTLIEILVVIGIIALLATIVIVAINPARQFAQARNTQRTSNVNSILNAIGQRIADNKGLFRSPTDTTCLAAMDLTTPLASSTIDTVGGVGHINLRPCLVPTYIPELPVDPSTGTPWDGVSAYNTQYQVARDTNGRVTVCAPNSLETGTLNLTEQTCVTR